MTPASMLAGSQESPSAGAALPPQPSPAGTALLLALSVFAAELLVMLALGDRLGGSPWAEALLDAAGLTLLIAPALYLLAYRPLVAAAAARERQEIARRVAAEQRLHGSEERFRSIIEGSSDIIAVLDADARMVYASPSVERLLGYPVTEMVDRSLFDFVHPDDAGGASRTLAAILAGGQAAVVEARARHRDGSWRVLAGGGRALLGENGSPQVVFNARDVTERKRAEEALRDSEERLGLALAGAELGLWDWDVASGRVVRNDRWAQMLGYDPGEVGASIHSWEELIHPDDRAGVKEAVTAILEGRAPSYRAEYRLRGKSGDWKWVLDAGKVVERDARGLPLRVAGTHLDMTRQKAAEAALRRARTLESLSVLAGGVAHDFNNLLGVVLGHVSLALRKLPPDSSARANLASALDAAQRAAGLTAKMLAYSGRGLFSLAPLDLSALVRESRRPLEAAIPKNVRLELRLADRLSPIEGDEGQLVQALTNLVVNAAEAIGERQGTVTVETGPRDVGPSDQGLGRHTGQPLPPGRYVRVEVRDDGRGMDEDTLGRIFDPFFSTKFTGRGLGLPVVLGVVRGHGGGIAAESSAGRGSRFELVFPEAVPSHGDAAQPVRPAAGDAIRRSDPPPSGSRDPAGRGGARCALAGHGRPPFPGALPAIGHRDAPRPTRTQDP